MELERLNPLDFEEINIVPMQDCIEHTDGLDCICSPTWDARNQWDLHNKIANKMMVVHRKIDETVKQ